MYLLLIIPFFQTYSQNEKTEQVIQYVAKEILMGSENFLVADKSIEYTIGELDLQNYQKRDLLTIDPDFPFNLLTKAPLDLNHLDWDKFQIPKMKFEDKSVLESFTNHKVYYSISQPIFSEDNKYCVIAIWTNYKWEREQRNYVLQSSIEGWLELFNYLATTIQISVYH